MTVALPEPENAVDVANKLFGKFPKVLVAVSSMDTTNPGVESPPFHPFWQAIIEVKGEKQQKTPAFVQTVRCQSILGECSFKLEYYCKKMNLPSQGEMIREYGHLSPSIQMGPLRSVKMDFTDRGVYICKTIIVETAAVLFYEKKVENDMNNC